jgi:hypothetical protein
MENIQKHGKADRTSESAGRFRTWSRTCWSARTSGGEFGWMDGVMVVIVDMIVGGMAIWMNLLFHRKSDSSKSH